MRSARSAESPPRAEEWELDRQRIGVIGFSAAGNLAARLGNGFDQAVYPATDAIDDESARPDFQLLIYPVIDMAGPDTHPGSRERLLGPDPSPELQQRCSMQTQVRTHTPPTFLVHASDDAAVPVGNSLLMYQSLLRAGVPAELHVFPHGGHGFGTRGPLVGLTTAAWPRLALDLSPRNPRTPRHEHHAHDLQRRDFLRSSALCTLAAGLAGALPAAARGLPSPIAHLRSGRVAGQTEHGIHVFRGIPYGGDTAPRRFQQALPETPWRGVRDALVYGPSAPQGGSEGPGSEDCLYLNVWTPALRDGGQRPVLVYIHGGAYDAGSGSDALYDGGNLSGAATWWWSRSTTGSTCSATCIWRSWAAQPSPIPGNVGQLDLIQALQWVHQHAAEIRR